MDIRNINLSFFPSVFMCSWHFLVLSEYCQQTLRIHNQNSDALSSWQLVFYCNLENGHQEYQFVFFPKCIDVFLTFPVFFKTLPAQMWVHHQEIPPKNEGAPEFWCPGTRTLVPFPAENRFFVLISRMGIRNINFSFFLSVFICSWHFLVLLEHCQHKFENTIKKTPKKNVGAPKFWCPGTRTLVPPMFLTVRG